MLEWGRVRLRSAYHRQPCAARVLANPPGNLEGGPYQAPRYMSWQSDYDIPELAEYLRIRHPQP